MKELIRIAEQVFQKHGGGHDGIAHLVKRFESDRDLSKLAFRFAAYSLMREVHRGLRKTAFEHAENGNHHSNGRVGANGSLNGHVPKMYSEEQQKRIGEKIDGLLDTYLSDRITRLRDATKELVLIDAEMYSRNAAGNLKQAKFYKSVAAKLGKGQRVAEVWTEEKLVKLLDKSRATGVSRAFRVNRNVRAIRTL